MLDKLFKKVTPNKESTPKEQPQADNKTADDILDETGTFMLDINELKDTEDLDDLLNDI